jgi:hypothetical protein
MDKHYCHKCSIELGHLSNGDIENINLTGSTYLLDKFIKHTLPPIQSGLVSIFSDPSYENYKNYTVNTVASGSTVIDQYNRVNVVWFSNQDNGISYLNGIPQSTTDVCKTVLHHDDTKIHSFPIKSTDLITKTCDKCGTNILTGTTSQ